MSGSKIYRGENVLLDRKQSGWKCPFTKLNVYNTINMTVHLQMISHLIDRLWHEGILGSSGNDDNIMASDAVLKVFETIFEQILTITDIIT